MTAVLIPAMYAMGGICAFSALHHGIAVMQRRVGKLHLLFALLSATILAILLTKAGAYQATTVPDLVALRRWEVSAICLLFLLFPWWIAGFTGVRPRAFLLGSSALWILLFVVNLGLPYGVQYVGLPSLAYLELPWGERVVDLRVLQRSAWHNIGMLGILVIMAYSAHACRVQYRRGQHKRAWALGWSLGLFFGAVLFNFAANRGLIEFVHLSDLGFFSLVLLMDLEMMRESRDQNRRMRDVLDRLPAAICLKSPQGHFQLANTGFATLANADIHRIVGKTDFDVFPPEQAERFHADSLRALETGQDIANEYVLECDGSRRLVESHHFPLLRPDGSAYAVCGVCMDITESRQKDEALHKFRRQIWHTDRVASTGAISASLAHEICQPLAAILNNAQAGLRFLGHEPVDLEEIRAIFQDIVRDDKRAGTIINGLRAMLQQQETPYADINLAQVIDEVLELLHSELIRHGVEVERTLETNLTVRANKTQIQQVVLNLIINAQEAMTEQPEGQRNLQISATHADGKARVSICDTGHGIAEDMLDRIFESFYTTKAQGLGVGLEVCRSIMESHRGAIWAEANPDRGATFHFTLPFAEEASATDSSASA